MKRYLPILLLGALFISACQPEEEEQIDELLLPYIEDFVAEAEDRNKIIDIDSLGLNIDFVNIPDPSVLGRCIRDEDGNGHTVHIDPLYWKLATELEKEYVVFHELGHCVLDRDHTSDSDTNGFCISIMEPGTGEFCLSNYSSITRPKLLDELFQ